FTVAVTSGTGAVVTLNGTDFMPVSIVEMSVSDSAGTPSGVWSVFPSTYQSASRISVLLPDALLHQPAVFTLRVVSPQVNNQGGGTSEERLFTVRAPVPVLTALVPTVATLNAQTGDVLVRVEGANFTSTSLVRIANVPVPTRYLSPTALEAIVQRPASAYTVTVNNPPVNAQGGGTSSGLRLVIVNPVPTLTAVQPSTLASTGAPDTLTLKGTNFITGVKVLYNGTALAAASVVVVNDSTLRVLIPTLPIAVTTHTLAVQQPSVITGGETFGGGASQALPLSIVFPVPTLTSLSPASTAATLNPNAALNHWTLTVRGTLFASNTVVLWNGQALATNVVNSTTLRATVPNTLALDSGTVVIRVKSDVPSAQGGGTSADSLVLGLYYPVPVLTGITPEFTTAATLTRLTLTG
ncbi:MAG: IPT/TIG domain-containing protein, partial [Candidatus Kapabacteria bacterium]|nr:IPT/TIG domain-containing protein [Candidatus Kapabacteria bacterium]